MDEEDRGRGPDHLDDHFRREGSFAARVFDLAHERGLIQRGEDRLWLTSSGRAYAQAAVVP